jgi:RNA polymerase sigma factor (sigma-70 family)
VSLPTPNPTAPIDYEQLAADVYEAVRWACLRYWDRILRDELDDFSQQIIFKLIEDDCRRLRLFNYDYSFKTWLQAVATHHVHKSICQWKQAESPDDIDRGVLIYSPPQDREIYATEKQELLFRALCKLSEQERLLYKLWFVSELAPIKIADIFGTEVKSIYKRKQTLILKLTRLVRTIHRR